MQVKLHANARLTPLQRKEVQESREGVRALALRYGVTETTIRRWRSRTEVHDRSHVRHDLGQSTSPVEEELIVALRRDAALSLEDIVEVMHRCVNPDLSRSAIYRCLRRYGIAGRLAEAVEQARAGAFEAAACGFIHIDLKHLPRLGGETAYVFVAIDRATRFVHIDIIHDRSAATAAACLERFLEVFPHPVHTILTDNGAEFTDRFAVDMKGKPEGKPSGHHPFDRICAARGICHKLTRPFRPQTNGMVERFNRRLAQALRDIPGGPNRGKNKFRKPEERNAFLHRFVYNYNRTRLQCLAYNAPVTLLHNLTEENTKAGVWSAATRHL
jgi:transposase InsO family protein